MKPLFEQFDITEYFQRLAGSLGKLHDFLGMQCFEVAVFHFIAVKCFRGQFKESGPFIIGNVRNTLYLYIKTIRYTSLNHRGHHQSLRETLIKSWRIT